MPSVAGKKNRIGGIWTQPLEQRATAAAASQESGIELVGRRDVRLPQQVGQDRAGAGEGRRVLSPHAALPIRRPLRASDDGEDALPSLSDGRTADALVQARV